MSYGSTKIYQQFSRDLTKSTIANSVDLNDPLLVYNCSSGARPDKGQSASGSSKYKPAFVGKYRVEVESFESVALPTLQPSIDTSLKDASNGQFILVYSFKYVDLSMHVFIDKVLKLQKILDNSVNTLYIALIVKYEITYKIPPVNTCQFKAQSNNMDGVFNIRCKYNIHYFSVFCR